LEIKNQVISSILLEVLASNLKCRMTPADFSKRASELQGIGKTEEAVALLNEAIDLCPSEVDLYFEKGSALHKLKRYEEAVDSFKKVIELRPSDLRAHCAFAPAYHCKGVAPFELGRFDEAVEAFNKGTELRSYNAESHWLKSRALEKLGRTEEAQAAYSKAVELKPEYALVLLRMQIGPDFSQSDASGPNEIKQDTGVLKR
jgi:tetratricopeptide (TPR) repeat protein